MKKLFTLCAAFMASCSLMLADNVYGFAGSGTAEDPYQITKAQDFYTLAEKITADNTGLGEYFALQNDIDFENGQLPSIAKAAITNITTVAYGFEGTLDGQGYSITSIAHTQNGNNDEGKFNSLISSLGENGVIRNLVCDKSTIDSYNYAAPFACVSKGLIEGCVNRCTVTAANAFAAGICGYMIVGKGTISDCTNYGAITATTYACGIVGGTQSGKSITDYQYLVSDCQNYGKLAATNASTSGCGGIAGSYSGRVYDCVNYADIDAEGKQYASGIVAFGAYALDVLTCTNAGNITGGKKVGGIVGHVGQAGAVIDGCINGAYAEDNTTINGTVSGTENVGGIIGNSTNDDTKVVHCANLCDVKADGVETAGHITGNDKILVSDCYYVQGTALPLDGETPTLASAADLQNCWSRSYTGTLSVAVGGSVVATIEDANVTVTYASTRTANIAIPAITYGQMAISSFQANVNYTGQMPDATFASDGYTAEAGGLTITGTSLEGTATETQLDITTVARAGRMPLDMTITFSATTTGIEGIEAAAPAVSRRYDLQGRRSQQSVGLFIENGKVSIVR